MINLIGQSLCICLKKASDHLNLPCKYTPTYHKQPFDSISFDLEVGPVILSFEGLEHFMLSYYLHCPVIVANMPSYAKEANLNLHNLGYYDKIYKNSYDTCLNSLDEINEKATLLPRGLLEAHVEHILNDCRYFEALEYTLSVVFNKIGKVPIFHLPSVPVANINSAISENKVALSLKIQQIVDAKKKEIFAKFGGLYLDRPDNVTDESGFLRSEYCADSVHGNLLYGIVQLNQMKSLGII